VERLGLVLGQDEVTGFLGHVVGAILGDLTVLAIWATVDRRFRAYLKETFR
jgi:hypothetical protein